MLPDRIADQLIARIFTRELGAGSRLPAERPLAETLGVDEHTDAAAHVRFHRKLLRSVAAWQLSGAEVERSYRAYLVKLIGPLQAELASRPIESRLRGTTAKRKRPSRAPRPRAASTATRGTTRAPSPR